MSVEMLDAAEQPIQNKAQEHESRRSFDPCASVNIFRYDLENFGQILPETRERVCDEELSLLAEGVERAACTSFVLKRQNGQLVYFNEGEWQPYISTLMTGLKVARKEAAEDPRKQFLAEWAVDNLAQGYKMDDLRPGERRIWYSSYDHEQEALHGADFMNSCGLVSERKMGFLYEAAGQADGSVLLRSQTVDRSDPDAFKAVMAATETDSDLELAEATDIYDATLSAKNGGTFVAGRRNEEHLEDAWTAINNQRDLVEFHLQKLEDISASSLEGEALEQATKRHVYGVWAAFKERLDARSSDSATDDRLGSVVRRRHELELEVMAAFHNFASQGRVLIGCGGSITFLSGEESIMNASGEEAFSLIFGSKDEDKYGSLRFKCPNGHSNKRRRNELLDDCRVCGTSVKC
jgi:hypothetical protein